MEDIRQDKRSAGYNPFSLSGKTILVTGASSGIGQAIAVECSRMGAQVFIAARSGDKLNETLEMMSGDCHRAFVCDLTKKEDVVHLIDNLPSLSGIVYNAGINKRVLCNYVKEEDFDALINTNLKSPVMLQKLLMKNKKLLQNGSIVFISSHAVVRPRLGNSIYSATKGALSSYARVLALELAPKKIRVNSIEPGMVWTNFVSNLKLTKDDYEKDEKEYMLGRYGTPDDVAYLAIYLLSDASSWMTANAITIDGGGSKR